jgi:predicted O-methyltransferase YrrM
MASSRTLTETEKMKQNKRDDPVVISKQMIGYVHKFGYRESEHLVALREETAKHEYCRMQSAPEQMAFFQLFVQSIGAKRTIEVGVFTGYSALATALALPDDGKLVALDISEEFTSIGRPFWKAAGVDDRIDLRVGDARETLAALVAEEGAAGSYDFAFVDADKVGYAEYYELLLKLIRVNGVIAFDNTLWHGAVVDESKQDVDTVAIRALNEALHKDERIQVSMIPLADGVTFCRKL